MSRKDDDPIWYKDLVEFKLSVESRLSKLETEMTFTKQAIAELKRSIEDVALKMHALLREVSESRRKDIQTMVMSIIGGTVAATILAFIIRLLLGA